MENHRTKENLLACIASDPWTKDNYLKLIQHLRNTRDEEDLERFRELFVSRFLPDGDFWRMWLADKIQLDTAEQIHNFFKRAFEMFPDFDLACDYMIYIEKCVEENDMTPAEFRPLLSHILNSVGIDMITGVEIWKKYATLEIEEFEDLIESSKDPRASEVIDAKKYIVVNVFRRQLSLPLMNLEAILQQLSNFLEEYCETTDEDYIQPASIKENFDRSVAKREKILSFESALLDAEDNALDVNKKIELWKSYIDYEMTSPNDYHRVCRLFERSIIATSSLLSPRGLFESFTEFVADKMKDWPLMERITRRGVIVSYDDTAMWRFRLLAIELCGVDKAIFNSTLQTALTSGFSSPKDYLSLLHMSCDFYRRQLHSDSNAADGTIAKVEEAVLTLRSSFDAAESFLSQYFPTWIDGWVSILRYRVQVEDIIIGELAEKYDRSDNNVFTSTSPAVWDKFISNFGKLCGATLWNEYLKWGLSITRDLDVCRKILRKAIGMTAEDPFAQESLCNLSVQFEEELGPSAHNVINAILKTRPVLAAISSARQEASRAIPVAPAEAFHTDAAKGKPNSKRLRDEEKESEPPSKQTKKVAREAAAEVYDETNDSVDMEISGASGDHAANQDSDAYCVNSDGPITAKASRILVSNSIFVKNISFSATEQELRELFNSIGKVIKFDCLKSDSGKFKGMIHIDYSSPEAAQTAVTTLNGHPVHNRKLTVEIFHKPSASLTPHARTHDDKDANRWHPTTIFVSNLPASFDDASVRSYFEPFGSIKIARLLRDKHTGETKCRALVEFESPDSLIRAMDCRTQVEGQTLFVTRSKFPAAAPPPAASNQNQTGKRENPVDGTRDRRHPSLKVGLECTANGSASTLVFKPRALKKKIDIGT